VYGKDVLPASAAVWCWCGLTFDMSGDRRHTKCAVGRPLDGGVRPHSLLVLVLLNLEQLLRQAG
jgi:hypothetical protein